MRPTRFPGDGRLQIGDTTISYAFPLPPGLRDDEVVVMKNRRMIERYVALFEELAPRRIVELGIRAGGSTAMIAAMTEPECLVAIELDPARVEPLDRFLAAEGLATRVHPYYGVDQADTTTLTAVLTEHFGTGPLDVVIDDASHLYEPTLASFELLFPRLRPGGAYVVEDWTGDDQLGAVLAAQVTGPDDEARAGAVARLHDAALGLAGDDTGPSATTLRDRAEEFRRAPGRPTMARLGRARAHHVGFRPLSRLAAELVVASAESPDLIGDLRITDDWLEVRRTDAPIDASSFSLAASRPDYFGVLHHPEPDGH